MGLRAAPARLLFQSSPAPRSGCNSLRETWWPFANLVSILTRSEERVQRDNSISRRARIDVSILTRSEERGQLKMWLRNTAKRIVSILPRSEERVQPVVT